MTPYLSIIIPVYNTHAYLQRCVRSVLQQDYSNYEIILVNDGSTDDSGALCDSLCRENSCIRVLHKENGGLSSARNAGLAIAQGQYVWWVDSDDWIESGSLAVLHGITSRQTPDMIKFNYNRVEQESFGVFAGVQTGTYTGKQKDDLIDIAFCSPAKMPLSAWSYVYRRSFLLEHQLQFVSERIVGSEDYLFNLEALLLAQRICVIPDILYDYEQRNGSLTQKYRVGLPDKYTQLYLRLRECYEKAGKGERYAGKISRFYVWHLLHGTCITNEYTATDDHSISEGRKNVRAFLKLQQCKQAIALCDRRNMTIKQKIQLVAMRLEIESVFYRLWKGK